MTSSLLSLTVSMSLDGTKRSFTIVLLHVLIVSLCIRVPVLGVMRLSYVGQLEDSSLVRDYSRTELLPGLSSVLGCM